MRLTRSTTSGLYPNSCSGISVVVISFKANFGVTASTYFIPVHISYRVQPMPQTSTRPSHGLFSIVSGAI
eukprot:XP_001710037.1 Hypothetical protein GL50803_32137 [Giardia lamblia ATCC 50803]